MKELRKITLFAGDVGALYLALALMLLIRYPLKDTGLHFGNHLYPFSLIFVLWLAIFYLSDLYQQKDRDNNLILFKRISGAVLLSGTASVIAFYLFGQFFELTPKINLLIFSGIFIILDCLWRMLTAKIFAVGAVKTLILGDTPLLNEIESYMAKNLHAGYQVTERVKNLGEKSANDISLIIKNKKIGTVIIQPNIAKDFSSLRTVFQLLPLEVNLVNAWDFYEMLFEKVPLKDLEENWFIEKITTRRPFYDASKRMVDLALGSILGLIFLPIGVLFAFGIKISSRGPAIFKQKRIGKNGIEFTLYKFRTMYRDNRGPLWTEERDERITPFGTLLRLSHLDEIPQLWNIIKGDISFTGPRPERIELAETFKRFPYYEIRHIIKPGLSGWAQIKYRPSASMEEAYEKLRYDIYYVKNRSFFLDLVIILRTIRYVFASHRR